MSERYERLKFAASEYLKPAKTPKLDSDAAIRLIEAAIEAAQDERIAAALNAQTAPQPKPLIHQLKTRPLA